MVLVIEENKLTKDQNLGYGGIGRRIRNYKIKLVASPARYPTSREHFRPI